MKTRLMFVVSSILFVVAIFVIWENRTVGITLLIIVNLLNLIRGLIDILHNRK